MDNKIGVYQILNKVNGKKYIGSSSRCIHKRWQEHLFLLRNNKHHSQYLQNAWNKHGESSFMFEIIEETNIDLCIDREQYYMDLYKSIDRNCGYNIAPTAGSNLGFKHSQRTKDKMSEMQQGKNNNRYGTKHSSSTIQKMSYAQKGDKNHSFGKTRPENIKKKISNSLMGIKRSEETTQRMSNVKKGKNNPMYGKKQSVEHLIKRIKKLCKKIIRSDGKEFNSIKEAAVYMNCKYQSISQSLRKGYRCHGYTFNYKQGVKDD